MIGTSLSEYILIRVGVWSLRGITPISISYSILYIASRLAPTSSFTNALSVPAAHIFAAYTLIESSFFVLVYLPAKYRCQSNAIEPPKHTREERRTLFEKCVHNIPDPESFLHTWFLGAPRESIKRENVKQWIRWSFFTQRDADPVIEDEVNEYVFGFEDVTNQKIEPGNGKAKSIRLNFDKVRTQHRPLVWYLIISMVDTLSGVVLLYIGYSYHRMPHKSLLSVFPSSTLGLVRSPTSSAQSLAYYHRPHKSKKHAPILYIHGIGIGIYPYVSFLSQLGKVSHSAPAASAVGEPDDNIGLIAIELPSISARLTTIDPSPARIVADIAKILRQHEYDTFVLAANSYGTSLITHMLHSSHFTASVAAQVQESEPKKLQIAAITMIDPIPLLLHLPAVAYNFLYRPPRRANERMLHYFASTDAGVAHVLGRHFFWTQNILWKDELEVLGIPICVSLGGQDLIVGTRDVRDYLIGEGFWASSAVASEADGRSGEGEQVAEDVTRWRKGKLDILWFDKCDHASVFDHERYRSILQRVLVDQSRRPASA